ncbi:MAG: rhomboid family intramembrane serine protease [Anaerolineae bacterium]|nr:rhomboid family intramembrane serine protease [Anaerolineae bacterium]
MLPVGDINPVRRTPILTWILIAINVLVFIWEISISPEQLNAMFMDIAAVPRNISAQPFAIESLLDGLRSMFLHGGFEHIIGNMLYLFLFGDNIEDRLGKILYLVLYFASGYAAVYAQVIIDPQSTIPMIGASGAIAGVLGAYLVMFPNVRVRALIFLGYFARLAELPALVVLGFWFVLQLFNGVASLGAAAAYGGGVAFFAHIGGFIAGAVLAFAFMRMVPQPPAPARYEMLYDRTRRG